MNGRLAIKATGTDIMNKKAKENTNIAKNNGDVIDIYELWQVIWNRKKLIIIFCTISVALTATISLIMTPIYRAETTILPIFSSSDISGLFVMAGLSVGSENNDTNKIMVILRSRTIKENIITKMNLINELLDEIPDNRNPMLASIKKFADIISISLNRHTKLITVSIEYKKPKLAMDIANNYIRVLKDILVSKSISVSKIKRKFLEKQIKNAENRLKLAQDKMVIFQKKTKMIDPKNQAKVIISLYTDLISMKTTLEVKLKSMEAALAKGSPLLQTTKNQLKVINKKIRRMEGNKGLGIFPSIGNAPQKLSEYADTLRELEISKTIYETVLKLYEQTKMEEAHEGIYIQVIDEAVTPDRRIKPKRTQMVAIAGFTSIFLAIFLVFFLEYIKNIKPKTSVG